MMAESFLTRIEVESMVGWSSKTLLKYWRRGDFPQPIRWGDKELKWKKSEVEAWMRGERDAQSAA